MWEYKTILNCEDEELNDMGLGRWELINIYKIHPENMHIRFVFKRKIT